MEKIIVTKFKSDNLEEVEEISLEILNIRNITEYDSNGYSKIKLKSHLPSGEKEILVKETHDVLIKTIQNIT